MSIYTWCVLMNLWDNPDGVQVAIQIGMNCDLVGKYV